MKQKEITIHGKQYPVVFDLQTIINFETITGSSIFKDDLASFKSRIAVIVAAILSADEDSDIKVETIIGSKDYDAAKDIIAAYIIVDQLAAEFYNIPDIEKENTKKESEEAADEEKQKN